MYRVVLKMRDYINDVEGVGYVHEHYHAVKLKVTKSDNPNLMGRTVFIPWSQIETAIYTGEIQKDVQDADAMEDDPNVPVDAMPNVPDEDEALPES